MSKIIEVPVDVFTRDFLLSRYAQNKDFIDAGSCSLVSCLIELTTDHLPYKLKSTQVVRKEKVFLKISCTKKGEEKVFLKGKIYSLGLALDRIAESLSEGMLEHQISVTHNPHASAVSLIKNHDLDEKHGYRLKKSAQRTKEKMEQRLLRISKEYI